jgi:molybdopterin converting factor small subunit
MIIRTKGYATLKRFTEHLKPESRLSVPDNATVANVLSWLAVPRDIKVITMINGRHCDLDHILRPEDKLVFFPPLEGG